MCPLPMCPITLSLSRSMHYYAHAPHCPCTLSPCRSRRGTCPIAHMPHHPHSHGLLGTWVTGHMGDGYIGIIMHRSRWRTGQWDTWVMGHIGDGQQCVKMSKDIKLSKRCQMSKNQTLGLWRRFTKKHN